MEEIANPCRSICKYNIKRYCIGCGRKMDEAQYWYKFSDEEKLKIIGDLDHRLTLLEKGELGGFQRGKYED
ncbi:DUF1289 domain-containing protein [Calditrichota bacterium]